MTAVPGLTVGVERAAPAPTPLRTDIAGFAGQAERGPLGVAVPVRDRRDLVTGFGRSGLLVQAATAYFANGGDVAYIVRVGSGDWPVASARLTANGEEWPLWIEATSPGAWADDIRVELALKRTLGGRVTSWLRVRSADGVDTEEAGPRDLTEQEWRFADGRFRLVAETSLEHGLTLSLGARPEAVGVAAVRVDGGSPQPVGLDDYRHAGALLTGVPDVSMIALPDTVDTLTQEEWLELHVELIRAADAAHDRLVLVDLPMTDRGVHAAASRVEHLQSRLGSGSPRAAAAYHPWIVMEREGAPTGRRRRAWLCRVPPCGHVAGLISRLDREIGPVRSPANSYLEGAADLTLLLTPDDDELLRSVGANPLRCVPGRGLQVWGARTLAAEPEECFVANRRLVHRLVRTMRRAAEPLVFEPNDRPLWLALNRALTSVLVEAWRSGAFRGTTPAEAFAVRCDETTADVDGGSVVAEVDFVPARPMERITLRILLGAEGNVEVIER